MLALCGEISLKTLIFYRKCIIFQGLGVTLVLLSVYRKALPALPISILLGFVFYLGSRFSIVPFLEDVLATPLYV